VTASFQSLPSDRPTGFLGELGANLNAERWFGLCLSGEPSREEDSRVCVLCAGGGC